MHSRLSRSAADDAVRELAAGSKTSPLGARNERSHDVPSREQDHHAAPASPPSDELVLAAIDRAERHRVGERPGAPRWAIVEHLGIPRRSSVARGVAAQLCALEADGTLARSRRHGVTVWTLTGRGRRRLRAALRAGTLPALPESPQHRAWRNARTAAAQELERFQRDVRDGLDEMTRLLEADPPASSDAWLEAAERLRRRAWRLASASHCLREWREPDDARADVDDRLAPGEEKLDPREQARLRARRRGRRNTRLWDADALGGN